MNNKPSTKSFNIANNGRKVRDLSDVKVADIASGEALVWDSTENKFTNQSISTSSLPVNLSNYQLKSEKNSASGYAGLSASSKLSADQIPDTTVSAGDYTLANFSVDSAGRLTSASSTTDVVKGPSSATDGVIPTFDSTTGKLIKVSTISIDDGTLNIESSVAGVPYLQIQRSGESEPRFKITESTMSWTSDGEGLNTTLTTVGSNLTLSSGLGTATLAAPKMQMDTITSLNNGNIDFVDTTIHNFVASSKGDLLSTSDGTSLSRLAVGTDGQILTSDSGETNGLKWIDSTSLSGIGDVSGAASSTDNAIVRFNGTDGKTIQNSTITISDTGTVSGFVASSKGDLITTSNGTALSRLGVGSDLKILQADSGQTQGIKWGPEIDTTSGTAVVSNVSELSLVVVYYSYLRIGSFGFMWGYFVCNNSDTSNSTTLGSFEVGAIGRTANFSDTTSVMGTASVSTTPSGTKINEPYVRSISGGKTFQVAFTYAFGSVNSHEGGFSVSYALS